MVPIDPNIVGPSYEAPMALQDMENLINWYVEYAESGTAKMPAALLGCPGLNAIGTANANAVVRALWVLPGNQTMLWVAGNKVGQMRVTVPATQTSIPQFAFDALGTLLTNNGRVCIRDNGVIYNNQGGYALLVDGQQAYFVNIAAAVGGTTTIQFTGGLTGGSTTLSLPGTLPAGLLISAQATLSSASGYIPAGTYISSINYSAPSITMTQAATVTNAADTITLTIQKFGQLTDPGLPTAPSRLAFIEGWVLLNNDNSRTFQTNGPIAYTLTFPGSFNALKDSSTDNLVTLFENNREAWLIGERTTEVWYDSGGTNFAFSRVPGVGPQVGCAAKHSIARMGQSLVWLARSERGENFVLATNQYAWERISTHAIDHAIASYPQISDAIGDVYEEDGHVFYQLTFPTADVTWVYDVTASMNAKKPMWHRRASFDTTAGVYHRHRANCFADFANVRIVGDYQSGQIHQLSRAFYTDNGNVLRCQRRTPHIWGQPERERLFFSSLQVEFAPGVGLNTGQGSNPQVMLRWYDLKNSGWSNEHWLPIGATGNVRNRAKINRLGYSRDRVWEITFTDPVQRDIIGATLYVEKGELAA